MFDDVNNKKNNNFTQKGDDNTPVAPPKEKEASERTPPALPAAPKSPPAPAESKPNAGVEDIFSDTDAGETEPIKPAAFQPKASPTHAEEPNTEELSGNKFRKIIIPLVLIVVLGAIGVGGMYSYKYVMNLIGAEDAKVINAPKDEDSQDISIEPKTVEPQPKDIIEPLEVEEPVQMSPSSPASMPPLDTDNDGLSDQEEISLGTNINSVDTDNDGLFDREEVYVYKTDPTNEDTDGDGFLDGAEVQDGYNPNGTGKLYEIN